MRRGLAVAGAVVVLSASASAASTTEAPERVSAHGEVVLSGTIDEEPSPDQPGEPRTGVAELRVSGPGVDGVPVARSGRPTVQDPERDPARVSFPLVTAACNLPGDVCSRGAVLANGTWTVQLFEVDRAAGADDVPRGEPATFVVAVPALEPQDVTATLEGRTVRVSWARGVGPEKRYVEPDVRWTVGDGTGRAVTVGPEACGDGGCSTTFTYADDASGPRTFTVAAARGQTPPTSTRAPGDVVLPAVPGASPSPSSGTGSATTRSLGDGFSSFAPTVPTLPALPGTGAPSVAAPQVADTFDPTLTYDGFLEAESGGPEPEAAAPPSGRDSVLTSNDALLDESALRSIAGALVLMLAGAHLRAWSTGSRPTEG